jgi:hypothetical protein
MSNSESVDDVSDKSKYQPEEWAKLGFTERVDYVCHRYINEGMNYPLAAYGFHVVKIVLLFFGWVFFCSFTPGLGSLSNINEWAFHPVAFKKAFIWSLGYEVLGFGCMSGPLGLKLWPPFTACLHYARPGTTKLPLFEGAPIIGGYKRTPLDSFLYIAYVVSIFVVLVQPEITGQFLLPVIVLLPLCALGDRTIFMSSRGEHHWAIVLTFFLAGNFIAASKWVQLAIWFWAGVSKLTPAFGYVVPIMTSNNPFLKFPAFRKKLFKSYPDDLSPSTFGKLMAHAGTFLELGAPIVLIFVTQEGPLQWIGVAMFIMLHFFILSNMPIAAVFEWNLLSVYCGIFLFWHHPQVSLFAIDSVPMVIYLIIACLIVPIVGNFVPRAVSFLLAMRYYAGNWAWNAWLFHDGSYEKLDKLKRSSKLLFQQQHRFLPEAEAIEGDAGFLAFRALHLQGRVLGMLLPKAIGDTPFQEYQYCDGVAVALATIGWDFGEGHTADEKLIRAIQSQCDFEEGEVRVISAEAQPLFGHNLHWRINDAKTGLIEEGYVELSDLAKRKPWDVGEI